MSMMQLVFEQIRAGGDRNFGYLLGDRDAKVAALIDPSYSPDAFVDRAEAQGLKVTHVVNTHGHPDHVNGNERAVARTGASVAAHPALAPQLALGPGAELAVGAWRLQVLHVPGHSPDHVTLYEPSHQLLITGDLLFVGKVGGTRTREDAETEWHSLQRLLAAVPDAATVWSGHDYGVRPSSTIALEKATNPFLLCRNLDEFLTLKADWTSVKSRLGLR
jgi:glyoxylase-like metal-dependent hydrolase (beta-lactamase superfamily II)